MRQWTPKRIVIVILGLWFAAAPALYAMPAAAMPMQTGIFADAGSGDCDGCPDLDADTAACAKLCMTAALSAIFAEDGHLPPGIHDSRTPGRHAALTGRYPVPEPAPPKDAFLH